MKGRLEELDAIRGLAALSVVVHHHLFAYPDFGGGGPRVFDPRVASILRDTPLHVLWDGHAAVILFFLLSGFVLALPFLGGRAPGYPAFAAKRICRIYVPYIAAVAVAVVLCALCARGPIPGMSVWFNRVWSGPITARSLLDHALFVGSFRNNRYDPVLWSLVHEMRISLIFPLIAALVLRVPWRSCLGIGLALSFGAMAADYGLRHRFGWTADYLLTVHYVFVFIAGALAARHREGLVGRYLAFRRAGRLLWVAAGVLLYEYAHLLPGVRGMHAGPFNDYAITLGGVLLIVAALGSARASRVLRSGPLTFLGRTSYSLYLYHAILLLTLVHLGYGRVPLGLLLVASFVAAPPVAAAAYRWSEVPSMALGRYLAGQFEAPRPAPAATTATEVLR